MREIELILPSGWADIDLRASLPPQLHRLAKQIVDGAPGSSDAPEVRAARDLVEAQLRTSLSALAGAGALRVLLEADPMAGVRTGTFIAVLPFPREFAEDPMDALVAIAAQTPQTVVMDAGELVVMRTVTVSDATDDVREGLGTAGEQLAGALPDPPALPDLPEGVAVKRTRAAYYVGDPGLPDDWMVFFTIITAQDDEDSQALVDSLLALSDAIVQSVRFS